VPSSTRPSRHPEELLEDLSALDRFGLDKAGGFTRLAWSEELRGAVEWAQGRMHETGLATEIDNAGNLIGRWEAGSGTALVIGSHLDTVRSGGRFDGALGVLAGIDVIRRLRARGFQPSRPIWVAAFMDEEGERFQSVMLGSRAFVGDLIPGEEGERSDSGGMTMARPMRDWDRQFPELAAARRVQDVHCYLELHAELGPVLDATGIDIGVVTEIVGLLGLAVTLEGLTNHAGTTPMVGRRDALVGAAKIISALREQALSLGHSATVGSIAVAPGGANAVPGRCTFSIDLRAPNEAGLRAARKAVDATLAQVCEIERLQVNVEETYYLPPVPLDNELAATISSAAEQEGLSHMLMSSGAVHDAGTLAPHVPAAMILLPSVGGVGHSPAERTTDGDVARGTAVLTRVVDELTR